MNKRLKEVVILIIAGLTIIISVHFWQRNKESGLQYEEIPIVFEPTIKYGIVIDSFEVVKDQIKRNEFLADILLSYNVDYSKIDLAVKMARPVFDVRRIRAGHHYSVFISTDSKQSVQYFIYEDSPTSYIVFDLRDTVHVHAGEKEVQIRMSEIEGKITSSLWNSLVENNGDPNLANELSEIYAWTIDFFGIQKGDYYRVIFEELYVDNKKIGLGNVHASLFNHMKSYHYAFYFIQDSIGDYFDENGGSLRRAFLKAPLKFKRISSKFSNSRLHPILKIRRAHHGVDYAAPTGTPVHSIGDGVIVEMKRTREGGNQLKIKHNGTYSTAYLHLSGYAKGIRVGKKVRQGELVAYVGSTGLSSGPHLDFRFYRNGNAIDPLKVESPPVNPVDPLNLESFKQLVNNYMELLLKDHDQAELEYPNVK
ncbi:MAG: M23 family metallopeptidase [Bacteroidetes bacterium]|nr:M23 family metallopeptidase [Bacteroidota bacterium]